MPAPQAVGPPWYPVLPLRYLERMAAQIAPGWEEGEQKAQRGQMLQVAAA